MNTDTYNVEVINKEGVAETITMNKVSHGQFRLIKRNPIIVDLIVKMQVASGKLEKLPNISDEKLSLFAQQIAYVDAMLQESAVLAIEMQHPALIDTLPFASTDSLIQAVIDNDIKECFGLGEVLKALSEVVASSESTTTSSTSTLSTTSVES